MPPSPVLLIGGSGVTGREVTRRLRERHPRLGLAIAGRELSRARGLAVEVGGEAMQVDLRAVDLALGDTPASAVIMLAKDAGLRGLDWARARAIPYIGISSAAFESGVDAFHALAAPIRSPLVLAGHWFAGAVVASALDLAAQFDEVGSIVAGVTVDQTGEGGGPASVADFQRIAQSSPTTLARVGGDYVWEADAESRHAYRGAGGALREGKGSVSLDVVSIAAGSGAADVRVLETWEESHSHATTGVSADEVTVEVLGRRGSDWVRGRQILVMPKSTKGSLTSVCVVLLLERALGLDGMTPASPGLYSPERLLAPRDFMTALRKAGARVETQFD